jgi:hypothetical protein
LASRGILELAVNSQLNAADRQQIDSCFRLARLDGLADPELPFPDPRHGRHRERVFDAPVIHGKPPFPILPDITLAQTASSICSLLLTPRQVRNKAINDSRTAALFRAVLALLVAGLRVETYWDCRTKVLAMRACVLPIGDRIMVP